MRYNLGHYNSHYGNWVLAMFTSYCSSPKAVSSPCPCSSNSNPLFHIPSLDGICILCLEVYGKKVVVSHNSISWGPKGVIDPRQVPFHLEYGKYGISGYGFSRPGIQN